eukprot:1184386-Prorocentrum_minimum.AAC.1
MVRRLFWVAPQVAVLEASEREYRESTGTLAATLAEAEAACVELRTQADAARAEASEEAEEAGAARAAAAEA